MQPIAIERALLAQRTMTSDCFRCALILIGESDGAVEPEQARRACWELAQIYGRDAGIAR